MSAAFSEGYPDSRDPYERTGQLTEPPTAPFVAPDPNPTRYDLPVLDTDLPLRSGIGAEALRALDSTIPLDTITRESPIFFNENVPPELAARFADEQPAAARPATTTTTLNGTVFTWFAPTQPGGDQEPPNHEAL